MHSKRFGCVLQIRRPIHTWFIASIPNKGFHFTPPDSGRAWLEAGVRPASAAACISEYLGSPVLSTGRGEQEQSKRAMRRRGIVNKCLTTVPHYLLRSLGH